MIKVFGIPHDPTASDYSAKIIIDERPKDVCVELHQSVVDDLMRVMKLATRTTEEEDFYRAEAGDGIVAIIESTWKI